MHSVKYVHWQEDNWWLGYLEDYPDYWTQGETLQDLVEHLKDLYLDLSGGHIPGARKVSAEIAVLAGGLAEPMHGDPADRLIVATTSTLDVPLVTGDKKLRAYRGIKTIW